MQPLGVLQSDSPFAALLSAVLTKPEAIPRPSQGYVAGGGALDVAAEDQFAQEDPEDEEEAIEEVAILPPEERKVWEKPERPRFERYAARLGLEAAPLSNPCVQGEAPACQRRALDRFFEALARAETPEPKAPPSKVRIVHFGDSLIASDKITDRVRLRLQERFGSAGPGFLFVRKFNRFQRGHRTGDGTGGWVLDVITQGVLRDRYFGYTGAAFTAQAAGEQAAFRRLGGARSVEVFYLADANGGRLAFEADGEAVSNLETRRFEGPEAARHRFVLPRGTEELVMRAETHGSRVFGLVFESDGLPGVVYESIGLPGATSEVWLRPDPEDFQRQLAARAPALVVSMVGGNDVLMLSKNRTTPDEVETSMLQFFDRVRTAVPQADCLIVSPLESVRAKNDGRMIPKPEVLTVIDLQRRVAERAGCGFWDMHASMGGEGSLTRWVQADLMLGDLIHPRSRGSDLLGEMMAEALMTAYDSRPSVRPSEVTN